MISFQNCSNNAHIPRYIAFVADHFPQQIHHVEKCLNKAKIQRLSGYAEHLRGYYNLTHE